MEKNSYAELEVSPNNLGEPREYSYEELCRMSKKRVVRIAGYRNIKAMYDDGVGRRIINGTVSQDKLSKKYIAKIIAGDR